MLVKYNFKLLSSYTQLIRIIMQLNVAKKNNKCCSLKHTVFPKIKLVNI